jgi:hypothetical protein
MAYTPEIESGFEPNTFSPPIVPNFETPLPTSNTSEIASIVRSIQDEVHKNIQDFCEMLQGRQKIVRFGKNNEIIEEWVNTEQPLVNDKGKWDIMSFLSAPSNAWSDLKDNEILKESADIMIRFACDVCLKKEEWGIRSQDQSALIIMIEKFIEYGNLRKISEKKMWDLAQKTVKEQRTYVEASQQKPRGLFGR